MHYVNSWSAPRMNLQLNPTRTQGQALEYPLILL
jgi:hypothetical protein